MDWRERITVDSRVLVGKPLVRSMRIAVELVVELLAAGWTQEQVLDNYPTLTAEDVRACLAYRLADSEDPSLTIAVLLQVAARTEPLTISKRPRIDRNGKSS